MSGLIMITDSGAFTVVYGPARTVARPYSVCRSRGPVFVACSKVNWGSVAMYKRAKEDGEGGSDNTQNETSSHSLALALVKSDLNHKYKYKSHSAQLRINSRSLLSSLVIFRI